MDAFFLVGTVVCGLFFAGVVALIVLSIVRAQKRAAERRAAISGHAAHREWEYRAADPTLTTRFSGPPFGLGYGHEATNVVLGRHDGRPFVAFDYHYSTTDGFGDERSTHHYHYSVVAMNLGLLTPGLSVGPTSTFGKLINAVTGRDIQVGNPLFDQLFTVTSPSPEFAVDVLHPDVVQVLLHHRDVAWRFEGDSMLVIRGGQHTPQEIEAKLHFMDAVLDRIPEHVRSRLIGEPPP